MKRKNFQLSEHFSYNTMTRPDWASRLHADNTPDELQTAALRNLCRVLLEPLYAQFGPLSIRCAFCSEQFNQSLHGVGASKHLTGEAVDLILPDIDTGRAYYRFIQQQIDYDQLYFEHRRDGSQWLHCSVLLDASENRHQAFPNYRRP